MQESLTRTLVCELAIDEGSPRLLTQGQREARRVVNEVFRLDREGYDWNQIEDIVTDRSTHVKNTTQQLVEKATDALERYYDEDDYGRPHPNYEDPFPLRMNHGEGYALTLDEESGAVEFRITAQKGTFVRGTLQSSLDQLEMLQTALTDEEWRVGTAEVISAERGYELHINITHETATVRSEETATTFVGVDVNENNVALAAVMESGVHDSMVVEYPEIKQRRHEFFTIRKRMQLAGQTTFETTVQDREKRFVHDRLHQVSREVVEWVEQFDNPVFVFEDLKDIRDDIEYGTRMNRRLHSLPFAQLQNFVSYKAAWNGIPSMKVNPEYTSQECLSCGHTERGNRAKKRFKCVECGFQDHADRKAAVSISAKGLAELDRNVPALNNLPVVRVRRQRNGASGPPDHDPRSAVQGHYADGERGSVSS